MGGIFNQIRQHTYAPDICFLCGCILTEQNRTVEHVIPKWLQRRFNLWDQHFTLLNKTYLPYRLLTIPCCWECNNTYLKPFEDRVLEAFNGGFEIFKSLDKETLFFWLGKIYFGLMYRELFLDIDRKEPLKGKITTPEYMNSYSSHFLFLQGIRNKHRFNGFFPASVYLFKTQVLNDIEDQWDIFDFQDALFIAVRMGDIGLISALQDGGAIQHFEKAYEKHRDIELHPVQFREIAAKLLYTALLLNRTPKFLINHQNENFVETTMFPLQGLSSKPIFDNWDNDEYAETLAYTLQRPVEECQTKKGELPKTCLLGSDGKSKFIDANKIKWF